jgi:hypothetical protein
VSQFTVVVVVPPATRAENDATTMQRDTVSDIFRDRIRAPVRFRHLRLPVDWERSIAVDPLVLHVDFPFPGPAWQRDLDPDGLRLGVAMWPSRYTTPARPGRFRTCTRRPNTASGQGNRHRLGSDRGSPNHGSTLLSKRVMAQIRSPARVST